MLYIFDNKLHIKYNTLIKINEYKLPLYLLKMFIISFCIILKMGFSWHSMSFEDVKRELNVDVKEGLANEQVKIRLQKYGENLLKEEKKLTLLSVFLQEIREPMIILLIIVGIVYSFWGEIKDALTIFTIITVLVLSEVYTEFRAKKSINALKKLSEPNTIIFRNCAYIDIPTSQIVPGDIITLRLGQRIPADARLIEAFGLSVDESSLTGESLPVDKSVDAIVRIICYGIMKRD